MNINEEKKNFFYIILMILTLITVIIGAAFAIYTFLHSQKEGSTNVLNNIHPIYNPTINSVDDVYRNTFKITNTGTLDGVLRINVEIRINEFTANALKYKVFSSEGNELTTGNVPSEGDIEIINNVLLPSESTLELTLLIWLEETGENQNIEMHKTLLGSVRANISQKRN